MRGEAGRMRCLERFLKLIEIEAARRVTIGAGEALNGGTRGRVAHPQQHPRTVRVTAEPLETALNHLGTMRLI